MFLRLDICCLSVWSNCRLTEPCTEPRSETCRGSDGRRPSAPGSDRSRSYLFSVVTVRDCSKVCCRLASRRLFQQDWCPMQWQYILGTSELCGLQSYFLQVGSLPYPCSIELLQLVLRWMACYRQCVISTIEGPGITKSECPTCHQPGWKKDLQTNHKFKSIASAIQKLKQELGTVEVAQGNPSAGRYCSSSR